jgi:hypothetical protein
MAIMANVPDELRLEASGLWSSKGCEDDERSEWFQMASLSMVKTLVRIRDEVGGFSGVFDEE